MNDVQLIDNAINQHRRLKRLYSEMLVLDSIGNQLLYLNSIVLGESTDKSRLKEIIIGVQTAREIENIDMEAAEAFYEVSELAKRL